MSSFDSLSSNTLGCEMEKLSCRHLWNPASLAAFTGIQRMEIEEVKKVQLGLLVLACLSNTPGLFSHLLGCVVLLRRVK